MLAISLARPHHTRAQGPNLLTNPDFEGGWYDISADSQIPNGWKAHWLDGVTMPGGSLPVLRPEFRVLSDQFLPPHEHYFIRSGIHCVKFFKGGAPIYAGLSQDVSGLEVGRQYRFIAPVYIDTYEWDGVKQEKVAPSDPNGALVRLGAGPVGGSWRDENTINYSSWGGGYLQYRDYTLDFVATATEMTVYVEFYSKWAVSNSGVFMDDLRLFALEMVDPPTETPPPPPENVDPTPDPNPQPPAATPTPRPDGSIVHIVVEGDTMFGLAIQYGVGLDELRRLNEGTVINDFLRIGQEVIISPGPMTGVEPTATPQPPPPPDTDPADPPPAPPEADPPTDPPPMPPASGTATLCLLAYFDANQDGFRQADQGEMALPNATITVVGTSGPVGEPYVTDGINEPHCIENLPPGNYIVRHSSPPGYQATDAGQWNIVLAADQVSSLELGYIRDDSATEPMPTDPDTDPGDDADRESPAIPGDTGEVSGMTRFLNTVLMVSGILILLLAIGVGVLFVLSRRA